VKVPASLDEDKNEETREEDDEIDEPTRGE
jgi:hypothetical protein